jgi:membrane fusion protein, macrolide-specific efflux system
VTWGEGTAGDKLTAYSQVTLGWTTNSRVVLSPMSDRGVLAAPERSSDVTAEIRVGESVEGVGSEEEFPVDRPRRKRKFMLIGAAVIIVLGAAAGLTLWLTGSSTPTGLVVTTQVVKVTTGTIKQTVATSGTIEPASQASLNFAVSGTVDAVNVKAGQTVTTGQVLATVGTTALQADLDSAQAQLTSAEARLSSDQSSGASTAQIDSDQAAVTSAESSLTSAQTDLSDASLTSTISGTVASVSLTVGQQVTASGGGSSSPSGSAGSSSPTGSTGASGPSSAASAASSAASSSSSSSSTAQIQVIGTNSYIVTTTVDDTEIGQIAVGDQATITPTGSTTPAYGTVASIGLIATESSNVATFPVVIDVTGTPSGLYAGSTADVAIIVKQLNNVVEVPTAAINYSSGGQTTVTQVKAGKDVTTSVTLGQAASGETQITGGVTSGDQVVERVVKFTGVPGGSRTGGLGGFGGAGGGLGGAGRFPAGGFGGGGGGGGAFTPSGAGG